MNLQCFRGVSGSVGMQVAFGQVRRKTEPAGPRGAKLD